MGEAESGGLKTPLKQKITLLRFYNLPLGIQPLKRLLKESMKLFIIELYVKRRVIYFLFKPFLRTCKKGEKRRMEKSKRTRQKKAETKGKGGEERRKKNRKLKAREWKNRTAN